MPNQPNTLYLILLSDPRYKLGIFQQQRKLSKALHRDIYSGHFPPPPGGGGFLSKMKNREEFEGGLHEKGREKGGKKEKSDITHVKIPL